MKDSECIAGGVEPIEDEQLTEAAGGGKLIITDTEEKLVKQLAARDGRTINLPSGVYFITPISLKVCLCHHKYKWCKEYKDDIPAGYGYTRSYGDVKCYNCGKTWMKIVN